MDEARKPRTAEVNGPLWGARARDWAEIQEGIIRPAYLAVLDRTGVKQGTLYLDIGCGEGMAAMLAAERGATVSGIDAASALVAVARERTPAGDFREGDLEDLPFADHSFDVVTSFNAVQFAGNPALALAEAKRVTRPGGVIAVLVWGEPEGMEMASIIIALRPLLPPPPPGAGGPFALSRADALGELAAAAGLAIDTIVDLDDPVLYPDRDTALRGLNSSGVAARAIGLVGEDAVTHAHAAALDPFRQADGSYRIGAFLRCMFCRV
jgi:SAM-dependent methyltransferase